MNNRMIDSVVNAASMVLEGILLTIPLWVVAGVGSAIVGVMYICK